MAALTIRFDLASFNPEVFGLTREQVKADPDLFAEAVSGVLAEIFKTIPGRNTG